MKRIGIRKNINGQYNKRWNVHFDEIYVNFDRMKSFNLLIKIARLVIVSFAFYFPRMLMHSSSILFNDLRLLIEAVTLFSNDKHKI